MNRVDGAGDRYVVGVDYGTLSGRALVVRVGDGAELGTAVHEYGDAVISTALPGGRPLPPDWALQNPEDYRDVLRYAVPAAVSAAGVDPAAIVGIGIDFTACTVLPTTADGIPLCEDPELRDRPHAWVKLWKHHAAQTHADRINALAHERAEPWIGRYGGKISAEWQYAKGLQMLEEDPEVYHRAERFIEAADWIVWQLCGAETRNVCTAGYKGILQDGQYPSEDFLTALNPGFGDFVTKLDGPLLPLGARAGSLTARAAAWTGLPEGIAVAVGNVDAHVTAASAQAVEPGRLVAIMGTSTCHVVNGAQVAEVAGMCGVVDGGISPGAWGLRGRAERCRRHLRLVRRARGSGRRRLARTPHRAGREPAGRRARSDRPGLVERQPFTAGQPRPQRDDRRNDPGHPAAGHLPGAAGIHRVRHSDDHRGVR